MYEHPLSVSFHVDAGYLDPGGLSLSILVFIHPDVLVAQDSHVSARAERQEKEEIMIAIIGWIIFGLIAGLIAKAIMPGRDPGGAIITILIGIAGSVIGGFIGQALFGYGRAVNDSSDLSRPGFLMSLVLSVIGAIVLLSIYRLIKGRPNQV
jgi:uncharacterized membrane protein YeaQ/YmgE (transglycosylase-associated protein family)